MDTFSVCRLCMCIRDSYINIFVENDTIGCSAAMVIADLLQLHVAESDRYPNIICKQCLGKLEDVKNFKESCLKSKHFFDEKFQSKQDLLIREERLEMFIRDANPVEEDAKEETASDGGDEDEIVTNDYYPQATNNIRIKQEAEENDEVSWECQEEEEDSVRDKESVDEEVHVPMVVLKEENVGCSFRDVDYTCQQPSTSQGAVFPLHGSYGYYKEEIQPRDVSTGSSNAQFHEGNFPYVGINRTDYFVNHPSSFQHTPLEDGVLRNLSAYSREKFDVGQVYPNRVEKDFLCEVCGKSFKVKRYLIYHMRVHPDFKPYQCRLCSKTFVQRGFLDSHESCHLAEKDFSCRVCSKKYSTKWNLQKHQRLHNKDLCLFCDECGKAFTNKPELSRHMVVHTGQKLYQCHICNSSFSQMSSLKQHIGIHTHGKFSCFHCSKTFTTKCDLKRHQKLHNEDLCLFCGICSKPFTCKSHLDRHMVIHTGLKLHHCDICGASYSQRGHLKKHKEVHAVQKLAEHVP